MRLPQALRLSLSRLPPLSRRPLLIGHALEAIAGALELRQRAVQFLLAAAGGIAIERRLRIPKLVAQHLQPLGDGRFAHDRVRAAAASDDLSIVFHPERQLSLLHLAERVAQFRGCGALA